MKYFKFLNTPLKGLLKVERESIVDERGFFSRFFCNEEFAQTGLNRPIVQMNHTLTRRKGSIRGLHFQYPPYAETKIVSCLHGEILDVAVDIRKNSSTFLQWHAELLTERNQSSLLIPEGFAHGFQTLTDNCELLYMHSAMYTPSAEGALNALDTELAITWPLEISDMSSRDRNHSMLKENQFGGVVVS